MANMNALHSPCFLKILTAAKSVVRMNAKPEI